jgi:branched-subunit amino acid ABC-type transport system permease component
MVDAYAVTVLNGLAYGLLLFTVAAGLTLIFGVAGVLNMAHGTFYLAGAYTAWLLADGTWTGLLLALAAGVAVGALAGGLLSAGLRPLADRHLDQALATLGVAFVAADVFNTVFGAQPRSVDPPTPLAGSVTMLGQTYPVWRLVFVAIALFIAAALLIVVQRSRAGAMVRAVVNDPGMAAATGIPTRLLQAAVLAAGGGLAVTAGVLGAPVLGPSPGIDGTVLVQSMIICVVGGLGSIRGALLAAVGVGQVQTLGVAIAPAAASFLLAAAMLTVLTVRGTRTVPGRPA